MGQTLVLQKKSDHDALLEAMPESATHDSAACELCQLDAADAAVTTEGVRTDDHPEGGAAMTEEEFKAKLDAAVAEAVAPWKAKAEELELAASQSETEQRIATLTAEHEAKVAELQGQVDAATLERDTEKTAHQTTKDEHAAEKAEFEKSCQVLGKLDERSKAATDAGFSEEYVKENAERFAAMSDEDWETRTREWAAIAPTPEDGAEGAKPPATAGLGGPRRETAGAAATGAKGLMGQLDDLRAEGVDARRI